MHACTGCVVDSFLYVFGGRGEDGWLKSVERFSLPENKWTLLEAKMPRPRNAVLF